MRPVPVLGSLRTFLHLVHQHGDGVARLPAAEGGAKAAPSRNELEGARRNLLARGSHTDQAALAPATVGRLERRAHHIGVASAIEGVVVAEAGGRLAHEDLLHRLVIVLGVEGLGAPELLGHLELGRVDLVSRGADASAEASSGRLREAARRAWQWVTRQFDPQPITSTPTISVQPTALQACTTAKPTAPRPKTATEDMGSTLQLFHTAPSPVETPQPRRHDWAKSAAGSIFAVEISARTVYSANVEQPMK